MKCIRMTDDQGVARVSNDVAAEAVATGEVVYVNKQSYAAKMRLIAKHERRVAAWGRGMPPAVSGRAICYRPSRKKGMI